MYSDLGQEEEKKISKPIFSIVAIYKTKYTEHLLFHWLEKLQVCY